jgi:hypothetical protein
MELGYRLNRKLSLAGWLGYSLAQNLSSPGKAEIVNWSVETALRDLGKRGSLLGLVFGQPPKVTSDTYVPPGANTPIGGEPDTSYHYEVFYRYPVNDHIAVTPGLIMVTSPENNRANDSLWVGVLRTTFSF